MYLIYYSTVYKGGSVGWGWNPVSLQFAIKSKP